MPVIDENYDHYIIEGSSPPVLKNKLNITNLEELKRKQLELSLVKLYQLRLDTKEALGRVGLLDKDEISFDANHLKSIHHYIFSDIYEFAGEYRNIDIVAKGRPPAPSDYIIKFKSHYDIDQELNATLSRMSSSIAYLHFSEKDEYAKWLSLYLESLIYIHPFRDGNGRAIKEYLTEFVEFHNSKIDMPSVEIDWDRMDSTGLQNVTYELLQDDSYLEKQLIKGLVYSKLLETPENNKKV